MKFIEVGYLTNNRSCLLRADEIKADKDVT